MTLPHYTISAAVDRWSVDPAVVVVLAVLLLVYLAGVRAVRRRGEAWPRWRTAAFAVLGLGFVGLCTMSSLAVYDHTYLWALAAQLTLLMSLAPIGIALGDPVGLARRSLPAKGQARLERALVSPPVRVLTFPVVSAVLAVTVTMVVFFSGILGAALHDSAILNLVYLLMLSVGCVAALPLLGAEMLPAWCTEPVKLLFSCADGLLDAIPGIVVMTTAVHLAGGHFTRTAATATDGNWDVHVAGALMLALTEVVTLPIVFILFFRWAGQETRRDHLHPVTADAGELVVVGEPELMQPWWETEGVGRRTPRLSGPEDE